MIQQYQVYWVKLDPTVGSEIKKTRPCVVVSPDEMNRYLSTIIVAPLTTKSKNYPTRVQVDIDSKQGWIVLDQLRSIDRARLYKLIGTLEVHTIKEVKQLIKHMLVD
ncbi:MAG: type II toxin-antitoxin system PemK/MazF family toxin [Roseivirga sp.]